MLDNQIATASVLTSAIITPANSEGLSNYNKNQKESNSLRLNEWTANTVFLSKINKPSNFENQELDVFVNDVKNGKYSSQITLVRNAKTSDEKRKHKSNLPAIVFGRYRKAPSKDSYISGNSTITIADLDRIPDRELDAFKDKLSTHPSVVACFVSPSGDGLKAFFRVPPIRDNAHSYKLWEQINKACVNLIPDIVLDSSGKDVARRCYVSSDPNIYINLQAVELSEAIEEKDLGAVPAVKVGELMPSDEEECIARVTTPLAKAEVGECHDKRIKAAKLAGGFVAGGLIEKDKILAIIYQISDTLDPTGTTPQKEIDTILSAFNKGLEAPIYSVMSSFDTFDEYELTKLQQRFMIYTLSGSIGLIDKNQVAKAMYSETYSDVHFYRRSEGNVLLEREIERSKFSVNRNKFWTHPNTPIIDALAFSPIEQPSTTLNYWQSYSLKPTKGDWRLIQEFLFEVISDSDQLVYEYILNFLAHMIQKPEDKPGVMPIMIGGEGIGKGTLFVLLMRIWAKTSIEISNVEQVVGKFNACLERVYVVLLDEAVFSGDAKSIDSLKNMLTEDHIQIEQKNQPSRTIRSFHRCFASTNRSKFARTDKDNRRFFFLKPSEKYKQNFEYFSLLKADIAGDVAVPAFIDHLINRDITNYNPRLRVKTAELHEQKVISLSGFDKFWYETLQTGGFYADRRYNPYSDSPVSINWEAGKFIPTTDIKGIYLTFDKHAEKFVPLTTDAIGKNIVKLSPSCLPQRQRVQRTQSRGFTLCSLEIARKEFDSYIGSDTDWDQELEPEDDVDVF